MEQETVRRNGSRHGRIVPVALVSLCSRRVPPRWWPGAPTPCAMSAWTRQRTCSGSSSWCRWCFSPTHAEPAPLPYHLAAW